MDRRRGRDRVPIWPAAFLVSINPSEANQSFTTTLESPVAPLSVILQAGLRPA